MTSTAVTVIDKAHATLGASNADRWMNCPGSVAAERGLPDQNTHWTREGTAAHALSEVAYQMKKAPDAWLDGEFMVDGVSITVTQEMADAVNVYLTIIRQIALTATHAWIERKFDLAPLRPAAPVFGTSDFTAIHVPQRLLEVVDLKYGKGVRVHALGNKQGRVYALGAWLELARENRNLAEGIEHIRIIIVQPRLEDSDGLPTVSEEVLTLIELKEFARELIAASRRAMADGAKRVAGEKQCVFCKAKAMCATYRAFILDGAQLEFSDVLEGNQPVAPGDLTREQVASVLDHADMIESWLNAVRAHALNEVTAGRMIPRYDRKAKVKHRKFAKPEDVLRWAKKYGIAVEDIMTKATVRSPAQIETHLKTTKSTVKFPAQLLRTVDPKSIEYVLCDAKDAKALGPGVAEFEPLESSTTE